MQKILRTDINDKLIVLLLSLVAIGVLGLLISNPMHTDEGFFWAFAEAKNTYGYYRFPAFEDVDVFKESFNFGLNRSILQIYRLTELLFKKNIHLGLVLIRFSILITFLFSIVYYSKCALSSVDDKINRAIMIGLVLLSPIIFTQLSLAREEMLMASLIAIFLALYYSIKHTPYRITLQLILLFAMIFLHWNAFLFAVLFMISAFREKYWKHRFLIWIGGLIILMLFYLIIVDPNLPLFIKQFKFLLISDNRHEKFVLSLTSLKDYIIYEFVYRYLLYNSIGLKAYFLYLFHNLFVLTAGLLLLLKTKMLRNERFYIIGLIISFVLLGNKYTGYLAYYFPILILIISSYLVGKKVSKSVFFISFLLFFPILLWGIKNNINALSHNKSVVESIGQHIPKGATIYLDFPLLVEISDEYISYTIAEKPAMLRSNSITLKKDTYLIANRNSKILDFVVHYDIIWEKEKTLILVIK
jgi:hypothetical protein